MKLKLALSGGVTALTGAAFINNVAAVVNWWRAFHLSGGDSAKLTQSVDGFIPFLNWTVVDYSAVSTLIPFLGALLVTRGLWRISKGKITLPDNFPYFRTTDQLNIALGLFGTLWGIIVIGFYKLDTVSMGDLMQCLHTALFSTLVAVVWVFMIDHPLIRPWMRRELCDAGLAAADDSDLSAAVDCFTAKLNEAAASFDKREAAFEEAFEKRQQAADDALAKRQREAEAMFSRRLNEADAALERRQKDADEEFARRQERYESAMTERQAVYEKEAASRLEDLRRAHEEESARHRKETEELERIVAAARAAVQEIEKTRAAAQMLAEKERQRADEAESRLASVAKMVGR